MTPRRHGSPGGAVPGPTWHRPRHGLAALFVVIVLTGAQSQCALPPDGCAPGLSPVACENQLTGSPPSGWDPGLGDPTVVGFTTDISTDVGGVVRFKISTDAPSVQVDVYRLGYYQGNGARRVATLDPVPGQSQPPCLTDEATGLVDCGNWAESATWAVPVTAVSGVYVARVTRSDTSGSSLVPFIVRQDDSHADIVFQTSDTTWQAYNSWGGNSLYTGQPVGRAYKVSYNRPFSTRGTSPEGRDFLFSTEYPALRWLEQNGYDISYQSGVDTDRLGSLLVNHRTFLSVGHDEYWSGGQRANVEAARDAGVNLAFLSGNESYWKTRYEPSIDGTGTSSRTLVSYKETRAGVKIDPSPEWTGTWRDPRFSPPSDGGRPENSLSGTRFMVNCCNSTLTVPADDGRMRFWRNTGVGDLGPGQTATLAPNTLGYEWDEMPDDASAPPGLVPLSTTTTDVTEYLQDYGATVAPGRSTHHLALHRTASGALVFSAGTIQWAWGLDSVHDGPASAPDPSMQQATVNLFADMGVQPTTLSPDLTAATTSTDTTAPVAVITSPTAGLSIAGSSTFTITGTATDSGGSVGSVEVSTDGGATWRRATGRSTWTYAWPVSGLGPTTVLARATDDSGNTQATPTSVSVDVTCPCSLLSGSSPSMSASAVADPSPVSLGVKFTSETDGFISAIRFYKGGGNDGLHTGSLWGPDGTRLSTAAFTNETDAGWQTASLSPPVAVSAGLVYTASYFAPYGRYAATGGALASPVDTPPLHAPSSAAVLGNGVYAYGGDTRPVSTWNSTNYWVDVEFRFTLPDDHQPPSVQPLSPADGATGVALAPTVRARFDEAVQPGSVTFTLGPVGGADLPTTTSYDGGTHTAGLTLSSPLEPLTTYRAEVSGARDLSGNTLAGPVAWTFTTGPSSASPLSLFSDQDRPRISGAADPNAVELGVRFRADVDGLVTGVRFYKDVSNTGEHVATVWTSAGSPLGSVTFSNETSSGWQHADLPAPVPVTAGTTYIVSYHAPNGRYSADIDYFATSGHARPPLLAPPASEGANGVYTYGPHGFPSSAYRSTNYWVDVVFQAS